MKKKGKIKRNKISSKSEDKQKSGNYNKKLLWAIAVIVGILILFVILYLASKKGPGTASNNSALYTENGNRISPLELITNKEKYEMKKIILTDAFIPSTSYIYVKGPAGFEEKLFITPKNSQYCMYFNLEGNLKRDTETSRDWIFVVDQFECVKKN